MNKQIKNKDEAEVKKFLDAIKMAEERQGKLLLVSRCQH